MSTWYEDYKKKIEDESKKLPDLKEIDQHIMWLKAYASEKLEKDNKEGCFTFKADGKFGFSEIMVNHLMQYAYDSGRRDIDKKSYDIGRETMWQEVLKKLDIKESSED